jgi:hypothetical protein
MGSIATGGGAFFGGSVTAGGDIVGRDQTIEGDRQQGDRYGVDVAELAALFQTIYGEIDQRPSDSSVEPGELRETVQKIEQEVGKGEDANPDKVERWLRYLADLAPDILNVTVAALINPVTGVAAAVRVIARRFGTATES